MKYWDPRQKKLVDLGDMQVGFKQPEYKWKLIIEDEKGITVHFETPPPNWLKRFMYKFLLGWKVKIL